MNKVKREDGNVIISANLIWCEIRVAEKIPITTKWVFFQLIWFHENLISINLSLVKIANLIKTNEIQMIVSLRFKKPIFWSIVTQPSLDQHQLICELKHEYYEIWAISQSKAENHYNQIHLSEKTPTKKV